MGPISVITYNLVPLVFQIQQNYRMSFKFLPRQPHHSPTHFIRTSRNGFLVQPLPAQFVPFVQERDSMGRLIKPRNIPEPSSPLLPLKKQGSSAVLSTQLSRRQEQVRVCLNEKLEQVEQNLNREFQYKCKQKIKSEAKNKISFRKNSLQIPARKNSDDEPLLFPKVGEPTEENGEAKRSRKGSDGMALTEPESPPIRRSTTLASIKQVRRSSGNDLDVLHEAVCSRSPDRSVKEKAEQRKPRIAVPQVDPKGGLNLVISQEVLTSKMQSRQISELNRYNTFKTLGLKLAGSLQQGHSTFVNKMRETKKLAYRLKISLEST